MRCDARRLEAIKETHDCYLLGFSGRSLNSTTAFGIVNGAIKVPLLTCHGRFRQPNRPGSALSCCHIVAIQLTQMGIQIGATGKVYGEGLDATFMVKIQSDSLTQPQRFNYRLRYLMSNPIPPLANATLVFAAASGYAVDSMTGNYVQIDQDATYYATLKQSRDPSYDQRIGVTSAIT